MAQPQSLPFNISILELTEAKLRGIRPVSVSTTFDASSNDFHPHGLFSVPIFGPMGDELRTRRVSYLHLKTKIFHPIIFKTIVGLKRLYGDIMASKRYAVWSDEKSDFLPSNSLDGDTGYAFFMKHWRNIEYRESESTTRQQGIKLVKMFVGKALTSEVVVLPAGLRDMEIDSNGRKSEDDINPLYRSLINLANTVNPKTAEEQPELLDNTRYSMQLRFNEIYDKLNGLIEGKRKLFLGKFASRRIQYGTRNVITAMDPTVAYLGAKGTPGFNSTIVGLYQYLKAITPVAIHSLKTLLAPIFSDINNPAILVNAKTLEREEVMLSSQHFDQWTTNDGLERVITGFREESVRNLPLMVDGRYMALVYKGPDGTVRLMHSISELPPERSAEHVHPITLTELLYLAVYKNSSTYPLYVTRYPITGIGSIYQSMTHLRTTLKFERRVVLDEFWQPMSDEHIAHEYPVIGSAFVNSLIPHPAKLGGLGAD